MHKAFFLTLFLSISCLAFAQKPLVWEILGMTTYQLNTSPDGNMDYEPKFPKLLVEQYEGEEVTLAGYLIPIDLEAKQYALSKNPFSSCFFCGNAGPETVVELRFEKSPARFATDEFVLIKGKLKLVRDGSGLFFIIYNANIHG